MSNFYSLLNQLVNNANAVTLTHIAKTLAFTSIVPMVIGSFLYSILTIDGKNGGAKKLRSGLFAVAAMLACFSLILYCIAGFVNESRTMPGYVEPKTNEMHVDNNGIFGTGYGGVGETTKIQPPARVVGEDGEVHYVSEELFKSTNFSSLL